MKRKYSNTKEETNQFDFFTGFEVEGTPAKNKFTLFIVGLQPVKKIEEFLKDPTITHIYFGANQSFDDKNITSWISLIKYFLDNDYWCSLDFDAKFLSTIALDDLICYNKFIPIISCKIPNANSMGYNAVVKIDDIGYEATNPGVWCWQLHDLKDHQKFTHWSAYKNDSVIFTKE